MRLFSGLLLCGLLLLASQAHAQPSTARPGRLSSEERKALRPGLQAAYESTQRPGQSDVRSVRMPALFVPEGAPATPFLAPGPFRCQIAGYLKTRLRGEATFSFVGRGAVSLWLNGEQVQKIEQGDLSAAEPMLVELVKGYNQLRLEYESPPGADAQLRMYWSSDEFPREPIPPTDLFHDSRDEATIHGEQLRTGRLAVAQHHCIKCHAISDVPAKVQMPEMLRDAPHLGAVGDRLHAGWMEQWILAPQSLRNKTTMPALLAHWEPKKAQQAAADLAAYLATLHGKSAFAEPPQADNISPGEALFEERGCIACHRFTPPGADDEFDRVSLHFLSNKYQPGAVASFLENPRRYYQWSRMPHAPLEAEQTQQLAAYLRKRSTGPIEAAAVGDPTRGAELFQSVGCAQCHAVGEQPLKAPGAMPLPQLAAMGRLGHGCLAEQPAQQATAPRFPFSSETADAMRQFLQTSLGSLERDTADDFSQRQWQAMSCRACHARDGADAVLPYALLEDGERGLRPDPIPDLTWAGEKLQPQWTQRLMAGTLPYRPRPHFHIRMPALPMRGDTLSRGISYEHGFGLDENPQPAPSVELAETGAEVAAMQTGLACHRCHAIGEHQATAPFEARSTNLSFAADRLRYDFYHRWMRDPMRVDPTTKMIKFAPNGDRTGLDRFYDGDARQQFEAVWHYLRALNDMEKKPRP